MLLEEQGLPVLPVLLEEQGLLGEQALPVLLEEQGLQVAPVLMESVGNKE